MESHIYGTDIYGTVALFLTIFAQVMYADPCAENPCQNGATCIAYSTNSYSCRCADEFTGSLCQTRINSDGETVSGSTSSDCSRAPCQNGGICVPSAEGTYLCICGSDYTGSNCEVYSGVGPIADTEPPAISCPSNIVVQTNDSNGEIVRWSDPSVSDNSGTGTIRRVSQQASGDRFTLGTHTVTYTATDDSDNAASCFFTITVVSGSTSSDCSRAPCQNGGTCVSSEEGTYLCICRSGYTGSNCEVYSGVGPIDYCLSAPCANDGTCYSSPYGYTCTCHSGFNGFRCESDKCTLCGNGASCFYGNDGVSCACPNGYFGPHCDDVSSTVTAPPADICNPNPCLNGGLCSVKVASSSYVCICMVGYVGARCEMRNTGAPPTIACPPDVTLELSAEEVEAAVAWDRPTVVSSTGPAVLVYESRSSGSPFNRGKHVVFYRYTDETTLEASCSFTVTISGKDRPQEIIDRAGKLDSKELTMTIIICVTCLVVVLAVLMFLGIYAYNRRTATSKHSDIKSQGSQRSILNEARYVDHKTAEVA